MAGVLLIIPPIEHIVLFDVRPTNWPTNISGNWRHTRPCETSSRPWFDVVEVCEWELYVSWCARACV